MNNVNYKSLTMLSMYYWQKKDDGKPDPMIEWEIISKERVLASKGDKCWGRYWRMAECLTRE